MILSSGDFNLETVEKLNVNKSQDTKDEGVITTCSDWEMDKPEYNIQVPTRLLSPAKKIQLKTPDSDLGCS